MSRRRAGPTPLELNLLPRLRAAANEVEDAKVHLELALERRDELVLAAVEEGVTYGAIAEASGVSKPHVSRILARSDPDADAMLREVIEGPPDEAAP